MKIEVEITKDRCAIVRTEDAGNMKVLYEMEGIVNTEIAIQMVHREIMSYVQQQRVVLARGPKKDEGEKDGKPKG